MPAFLGPLDGALHSVLRFCVMETQPVKVPFYKRRFIRAFPGALALVLFFAIKSVYVDSVKRKIVDDAVGHRHESSPSEQALVASQAPKQTAEISSDPVARSLEQAVVEINRHARGTPWGDIRTLRRISHEEASNTIHYQWELFISLQEFRSDEREIKEIFRTVERKLCMEMTPFLMKGGIIRSSYFLANDTRFHNTPIIRLEMEGMACDFRRQSSSR